MRNRHPNSTLRISSQTIGYGETEISDLVIEFRCVRKASNSVPRAAHINLNYINIFKVKNAP